MSRSVKGRWLDRFVHLSDFGVVSATISAGSSSSSSCGMSGQQLYRTMSGKVVLTHTYALQYPWR